MTSDESKYTVGNFGILKDQNKNNLCKYNIITKSGKRKNISDSFFFFSRKLLQKLQVCLYLAIFFGYNKLVFHSVKLLTMGRVSRNFTRVAILYNKVTQLKMKGAAQNLSHIVAMFIPFTL